MGLVMLLDETTPVYTMSTITGAIASVFEAVIGMVSDVAETIAGEPLLLFCFVLGLCGIAVGMFKRLISAN